MSPVATLVERSARYLMLASVSRTDTAPSWSPTRWPARLPPFRGS
jgi:DNA segregation ATPase FtsK/SpoIIIE-like protein